MSDANRQPSRPAHSVAASESSCATKEKVASLRAQLADLTLHLKTIKQTRAIGADVLLTHGSYWRTEAKYHSRQRSEAEQENERLKAQLHAQKQFAMRLVNMMKRQPRSRICQTLNRYEHAAMIRFQAAEAEFNQAFLEAQKMLAATDSLDQCSTVMALRQKPSVQRGFTIEFRMRVKPPCDMAAISEAIWLFRPHQDFSKRFIYEHIEFGFGDTVGYTCRFQPRQWSASSTQFRGEFLQRRYVTEGRVVILLKIHAQTIESNSLERIHMRGVGYNVIQTVTSNQISITTVVWSPPESAPVDLGQAQHDPSFRVVMDFMKLAFDSYALFAKQLNQ